MAQSATLECELREKLGSRQARKLRANGRMVASLLAAGDKPNVHLHFDAKEFLGSRNRHVHLYDLAVDGGLESAVVRELQWNALGSEIVHVEFKRVTRGVATEAEIDLRVYGQVKDGVLNLHVHSVTIRCMPSEIPDDIELKAGELEVGAHVYARDLDLPEGAELAVDPDLEIAVVSVPTEEPEEPVSFDEEVQPEVEGEEPAPSEEEGEQPTEGEGTES